LAILKFHFNCAILRLMSYKKILVVILILCLGAVIFASGFYIGKGEKVYLDPSEEIDLLLLSEVYYLLKEKHPAFDELEERDLVYGIIKGMVGALEDPHTVFLNPERSKFIKEDISGEFEGVGIEIGIRNGNLKVISPIESTPAYEAGIEKGDIILTIDGVSTDGFVIEDAVSRIRGPKGEEVVLGIEREGKEKEISIVRDVIELPSVTWEIIEEDIAYIRLSHFHEEVSRDFAKAAQEIRESSAKGIILDLRGNPGGIFGVAIDIASYFMETNNTITIETGAKGEEDKERKIKATRVSPKITDYPLVVLINEGSASASEIVVGALRDNRSTPVIGMNSFGKGSIQRLHSLSDGSSLKLTERYFLTPEGKIIDGEGIEPDFEEEFGEEDQQLQKAVEVLKEIK